MNGHSPRSCSLYLARIRYAASLLWAASVSDAENGAGLTSVHGKQKWGRAGSLRFVYLMGKGEGRAGLQITSPFHLVLHKHWVCGEKWFGATAVSSPPFSLQQHWRGQWQSCHCLGVGANALDVTCRPFKGNSATSNLVVPPSREPEQDRKCCQRLLDSSRVLHKAL